MKYLSVILNFLKVVIEYFICVVLIIFVFLPMALLEGIDYLMTSKEDKKFLKDFRARQKERENAEYRISFFPVKEMDCGPFSYIKKFKGRDNAEKQLTFLVESDEEDDETACLDNKKFLWGKNEENEIIIDSVGIRKIQK